MRKDKIINVIIILTIALLAYSLVRMLQSDATYVRSSLNNKEYLVQNYDNKQEAAYILSVINERMEILKKYLQANKDRYPTYKPYIEQFISKLDQGVVLQENAPDGKYTSYTVNKGEEIALCLRSRETNELHDINLITYVALHELAHVACPEKDHTELFKDIFRFLLRIAIQLRIYQNVNYQYDPQVYCGLVIRENLIPDQKTVFE